MQSVAACRDAPRQAFKAAPWHDGFKQNGGFGRAVSGTRGDFTGTDPTGRALAQLEAAVERLAEAASRPRPAAAPIMIETATADMVPRSAVAAIADRLDETIARLRAALGEEN